MTAFFMNSVYDWKYKLKPKENIAEVFQDRIIQYPRGFTLGGCRYLEVFNEKYRETPLLTNLGSVDFDLGYSAILPSCSSSSANFPSAQAETGRGRNSQNQSQLNPGSTGDGSPCSRISFSFIAAC